MAELAAGLGIPEVDAEDSVDLVLFPPGRERPKRTAEEFRLCGRRRRGPELGEDVLGLEGDLDAGGESEPNPRRQSRRPRKPRTSPRRRRRRPPAAKARPEKKAPARKAAGEKKPKKAEAKPATEGAARPAAKAEPPEKKPATGRGKKK